MFEQTVPRSLCYAEKRNDSLSAKSLCSKSGDRAAGGYCKIYSALGQELLETRILAPPLSGMISSDVRALLAKIWIRFLYEGVYGKGLIHSNFCGLSEFNDNFRSFIVGAN